jgi:hypothetical protein
LFDNAVGAIVIRPEPTCSIFLIGRKCNANALQQIIHDRGGSNQMNVCISLFFSGVLLVVMLKNLADAYIEFIFNGSLSVNVSGIAHC